REFGKPTEIYIDPDRMKEALLNIFTNAVHALHGKGTIFVKTYVDGDSAVIEIQDTGKGMSEEILPYIFDPFFTTKDTGTGLGLTIAQRIIEEHNGRVEVESQPHRGSIFKVFIPLQSEIKNSK
ncbi:MAG: histidine kinase, partial [Nitrospira sp.]|nr:histidine kinase [Nitrospira sp.]